MDTRLSKSDGEIDKEAKKKFDAEVIAINLSTIEGSKHNCVEAKCTVAPDGKPIP